MTATELEAFVRLVDEMRQTQKLYFRTHDANVLNKSKELERKVDAAIKKYDDDKLGGKLFD